MLYKNTVQLYLSSAFDTMDHNIISIGLNELEYTLKSTVGLYILFHLEYLQ